MKRNPRGRSKPHPDTRDADEGPLKLRIVGGSMRGRPLRYSGDRRVRPMKDRTREAVFNLLGPRVRGMYAWDLFAGTGAMGFEAISRGAIGATLIERHIPTSKLVRENAETLEIRPIVEIV
ncbi:MAG: RsmD family RNA methyltransferase, partial [Planctomycetales bacterium]|nr:RsmD family RNA methyltransferase [Planctomycetales bacterium]